ncbi:MAG: hypothetical protein AAFV33_22480 [Chloroflexota bacterium]
MSDVTVRLDDHYRLVSAVLAATTYPEKSQAEKPHGTHAHARATSRYLREYRDHPAVQGMQGLVDNGAPLEAMFTLIAHLPWPSLDTPGLPKWVPANWNHQLVDFYQTAKLGEWWEREGQLWNAALDQSQRMFRQAAFKTFLSQFVGEIAETLVFVPNICYPADNEIGIRVGAKELVAVCPPRLAWGDSPPWPYDEDKPYIHRVALTQYTRLILLSYLRANSEIVVEAAKNELPVSDQFRALYPTWGEQFVTIFVTATMAIYLETIDPKEKRAFVKEQTKIHNMKILPGAVSVLQRYLQERESGKFDTLADFLPVFPKQLKVAKRIISI